MGSSCLQILDPKIWLSSEISDPKHGTRRPPYANMASTPLGLKDDFQFFLDHQKDHNLSHQSINFNLMSTVHKPKQNSPMNPRTRVLVNQL